MEEIKRLCLILLNGHGKKPHPYPSISSTSFDLEVLATLVNLMFAIPCLQWDRPIDHFETFSGDMEVTKNEWLEGKGCSFVFHMYLDSVLK